MKLVTILIYVIGSNLPFFPVFNSSIIYTVYFFTSLKIALLCDKLKSSDIRHVISDRVIPDARSHCNFMSDTITDITYDRSQLTYTRLCGHDLNGFGRLYVQTKWEEVNNQIKQIIKTNNPWPFDDQWLMTKTRLSSSRCGYFNTLDLQIC